MNQTQRLLIAYLLISLNACSDPSSGGDGVEPTPDAAVHNTADAATGVGDTDAGRGGNADVRWDLGLQGPRGPRGDPASCKGVWIGHVAGGVHTPSGVVPESRRYTICGNACLVGDLDDAGRIDHDLNFCYDANLPLIRPVFIYHGGGRVTDLTIDFVGPDRVRIDTFDLGEITVFPLDSLHTAPLNDDGTVALRADDGLELIAAEAVSIFSRTTVAMGAIDRPTWPPVVGIETLDALFAAGPEGTSFPQGATLVLPNVAELAGGTHVELVALGDTESADPYAGTLGVIDTGTVSDDGTLVTFDTSIPGLTWLGYRAVE